jgi:hypothetical protein
MIHLLYTRSIASVAYWRTKGIISLACNEYWLDRVCNVWLWTAWFSCIRRFGVQRSLSFQGSRERRIAVQRPCGMCVVGRTVIADIFCSVCITSSRLKLGRCLAGVCVGSCWLSIRLLLLRRRRVCVFLRLDCTPPPPAGAVFCPVGSQTNETQNLEN